MRATLVGGSLHGTLIDVTDPQAPVRRFFRRDGIAWFECYEPAASHRPGDGDVVLRFSVPLEDRAPEVEPTATPGLAGERRVRRERRLTPSAGRRRSLVSA